MNDPMIHCYKFVAPKYARQPWQDSLSTKLLTILQASLKNKTFKNIFYSLDSRDSNSLSLWAYKEIPASNLEK